MEHTSDLVYEGKLIHETSYPQRPERYTEIELDGIKIDYFDPKEKVIHEVKKSDSYEEAHAWQLKYYIYILEQNGIHGVKGILEYPKFRETREVFLSGTDKETISEFITDIIKIAASENCPNALKQSRCKNCSYFDFCYANEIF